MKINYLKPEIECTVLCARDLSLCEVSYGAPGNAGNPLTESEDNTYDL